MQNKVSIGDKLYTIEFDGIHEAEVHTITLTPTIEYYYAKNGKIIGNSKRYYKTREEAEKVWKEWD